MKKITWFLILILILGGGGFYIVSKNTPHKKTVLRVGYPGYWRDLVPSLQHTAFADALMRNQYEALVGEGEAGTVTPVAAKSWTISEDKKTIVFKINMDKKFSNGESLTAKHFKDSWEYGLSLDPKSSNSSLQDSLYKVVGYDDFKDTGKLLGVEVIDSETLEVNFKEPVRIALNFLAGTRMAAFIKEGEKYLGTGSQIIQPEGEEKIRMIKNPFATEEANFDEITVEVVKSDEAEEALMSGKIDLYGFSEIANIRSCYQKTTNIDCHSGPESRHINLKVNGMKGRFFSNPRHRLAFQYLMLQDLKENYPVDEKFKTRIDPQIYLPFQAGRLSPKEAQKIIDEGKPFVNEFLDATKKNPLFLATSSKNSWFKNWIIKKGIKLTKNSVHIPGNRVYEMNYKTFEPDLLFSYTSVVNGDPDGIYHALGRNGAISTPMVQREKLMDLLEEGRGLFDLDKINEHYKKVNEAALREIPIFHFGFLKTVVAYRSDRINVKKKYKHRGDNRFIAYEAI